MKNLNSVLQSYRAALPNSSLTAQAIDRGALLEEISQLATAERIHQLAAVLCEAEQEAVADAVEQEPDLEERINQQIRTLRSDLPDGSKTARAIDRRAPWIEICECASEEGLTGLSAVLFEADQEKMAESPA